MAIDELEYEVVRTYPDFELRHYTPHLVAETAVSGDFDEVGNTAFRILPAYIFGENRATEKMEMTAPSTNVQQPGRGVRRWRWRCRSPSVRRAGRTRVLNIISFVMPLRYTPDTLPEPLNPRIRLRKDSAKLM